MDLDVGGGADEPAARRVFGAVAEGYDAGRPGYHSGLVGEVLAYAGPGCRAAVEVGAGTGKATVPFAAAGLSVLCVEPDPRMADVLRANVAGFPAVDIEVSDFEDWSPGGRRFDLLFAATSWHWIDRHRRWALAVDALRPGGVVALFWNPLGVVEPGVHAELERVDRRYGIRDSSHAALAAGFGPRAGDWDAERMWPAAEIEADGRFGDLRAVRFRDEIITGTEDYLKLLDSTSTYRLLEPGVRERALADTARVLERNGGGVHLALITDLCLARLLRSSPEASGSADPAACRTG
jgi:SAM-dependent methyltransferase